MLLHHERGEGSCEEEAGHGLARVNVHGLGRGYGKGQLGRRVETVPRALPELILGGDRPSSARVRVTLVRGPPMPCRTKSMSVTVQGTTGQEVDWKPRTVRGALLRYTPASVRGKAASSSSSSSSSVTAGNDERRQEPTHV